MVTLKMVLPQETWRLLSYAKYTTLQKARVKSGDRILEFGSGWGGLAIEVTFFPSRVKKILTIYTGCSQL